MPNSKWPHGSNICVCFCFRNLIIVWPVDIPVSRLYTLFWPGISTINFTNTLLVSISRSLQILYQIRNGSFAVRILALFGFRSPTLIAHYLCLWVEAYLFWVILNELRSTNRTLFPSLPAGTILVDHRSTISCETSLSGFSTRSVTLVNCFHYWPLYLS